MSFYHWLWTNWSSISQTAAIAGGLGLVSIGLLVEARARRVANLIELTREHRRLWERMYRLPQLARILDSSADLSASPVTAEEELFVIFIILHLSNTYYGIHGGFFQKPRGLRKDIELFFSRPIARAVWGNVKDLQEERFVKFVENCLSDSNL